MVAVNYLWNPINDNIVREFDDSDSTIAEYTTEPDLYGNIVSQNRDGQTNYPHFDGQGNTTEVTNEAGNVTDAIRYSSFGAVTQRTGATENPFLYVGRKGYCRDEMIAQLSVRRRQFLPAGGRWLCADPLGLAQDVNVYRYSRNSPTVRLDPSGLRCDIAIRCGPAVWLWITWGTHCGLVIETDDGKFWVDGSGGNVNIIQWEEWGGEWGPTGPSSPYPDSTCKCFAERTDGTV
jgi:RHS repeat-associated protein